MSTDVSAAALIYDDDNRLLLAQRSSNKTFAPNVWETIGGGIEFGESPEACLRREIREELGDEVTIMSMQLFGVYNFVYDAIHLISIVYLVRIVGAIHSNFQEIQDVRWVTQQEAEELEFGFNCKERVIDFFNLHNTVTSL